MNMEINPSEYKVLIVDDVISNVLLLKVLLTNEMCIRDRKYAIWDFNHKKVLSFVCFVDDGMAYRMRTGRIRVDTFSTVSYTHLDVYKRQGYSGQL